MIQAKGRSSVGSYKYDAALSFAGEDRKQAESLYRHLTRRGLSVFYDVDRQGELWGRSAKAFEPIYGRQARYVIPFVSKHYVAKDWTLYEFETAKREQVRRHGEFILPVRLDDSRLLGLHDDIVYLDARDTTISQIAKFFAAKCRPRRPQTTQHGVQGARSSTIGLLEPAVRQTLDLIASAPVPLPQAYYQKLFPKYDWARLIRRFLRLGILQHDELLILTEPARRALQHDVESREASTTKWLKRLEPLAAHIDTGGFLAVHLFGLGRFEAAARVVVDIAHYPHLGSWNAIYLTLLNALARRRTFSKLTRSMQIHVLNAQGICLSQARDYRRARARFAQLRRLSKRYRNAWGLGQSFINAGTAAHGQGDRLVAQQLFTKAVAHAKRSRDRLLLGRALGNLAQLWQDKDLERAERLLDESRRAKMASRDYAGLVATWAVSGNLAAARGNFDKAEHHYQQAAHLAARSGLRYEYAQSTYNHGCTLSDRDKTRAALRLYAKARDLASRDDYTDILLLSLNAYGTSAFQVGQYSKAHTAAVDLLALARRTKHPGYELSALHMAAVSLLGLGRTSESQRFFRTAIKIARIQGADRWLARCLIDSTRKPTKRRIGDPDDVRLQGHAKSAVVAGRHQVAAQIWEVLARMNASRGTADAASEAYSTAAKCLESVADSTGSRLDLYRNWSEWAWRARRYEEAIRLLTLSEKIAQQGGRKAEALATLDQRGVCLQELGRHSEARLLHSRAAVAAQRLGDDSQLERSLNNLGEALRHLNHFHEAVRAFRQSEAIARRLRSDNSAISTAHNRALAIEALGRSQQAARVLRECRDQASRRGFWDEHVRAWEALASLEWSDGRPRSALRLYRRARREARKHRIRDFELRITLNMARLLAGQRQFRAGIRALEPVQSQFDQLVDAHLYFGTLANLYAGCERAAEAAAAWRTARVRAESASDRDYASYCAAQEQQILTHASRAKISEAALRTALKNERDPERRVDLLTQRLELLLKRKSRKLAQAAFDEALRICTDHGLHFQEANLYLLVGDHNLSGRYEQKLEAFKAYMMAMTSKLDPKLAGSGEVGSHIVFKIASEHSPVKEDEAAALVSDLETHVRNQLPAGARNADFAARFLLWPFRLAEQLIRFRKRPRRFLEAVKSLTSPESLDSYLKGSVTSRRQRAITVVRQ